MAKQERNEFAEVDPKLPYSKLNDDIANAMRKTPRIWWICLGISSTVLLSGIITFYYQTVAGLGLWGTGESVYWGLDLPTFIFFIGLSHSGTLISAILLFTRSAWRRPIFRSAEAMTFFSLIVAQVILLMHVGRPWRLFYLIPYPNYRGLWTSFRSALSWDMIAISSYMLASGLFLLLGSIPDFAAIRNRFTGWRKKFFNIMSCGWKGTDRQWRNLSRGYIAIAALILPLMVSVHSIVAWDFVVTNVPGFHSTIFAPFFVLGALYSGVAGVVIVMIVIRKTLHMQDYIKPYHISMLAKMLLAVALIWIWITTMETLGSLYKSPFDNFEYIVVIGKLIGNWSIPYWTMIATCGIIPLAMFFEKVRTNLTAMLFITIGIEVGMWIERFTILVPGQAIGHVPAKWSIYTPQLIEPFLFLVFTTSIFLTLFILFVKLVPPISVFEVKETLNPPTRKAALFAMDRQIGKDVKKIIRAKDKSSKILPEVVSDEE